MAHRHQPTKTYVRPFFGPVAARENRAAHGNVCVIDTCSCGAERRTNRNQGHLERGTWTAPERSTT